MVCTCCPVSWCVLVVLCHGVYLLLYVYFFGCVSCCVLVGLIMCDGVKTELLLLLIMCDGVKTELLLLLIVCDGVKTELLLL